MRSLHATRTVKIPKTVELKLKGRTVTVTGKQGELTKTFPQSVTLTRVDARHLRLDMWYAKRRQLAALRSVASHITNMIKGASWGYKYKIRIVHAHFPPTIDIVDDGKAVEIRNFMGEYIVRTVKMLPNVTMLVSKDNKDEYILQGPDVDNVSQSAANVHQCCLVKNKDIRKFLDGIYVSEKGFIEK